jgi:hypothetical protein
MAGAAADCLRKARPATALSHLGGIVALTLASACASPVPTALPRPDGPYIAQRPQAFEGRVVGTGHCVALVQAAAGAPQTAAWQRGATVYGNADVARGTAIATFEADGGYRNASGSHAAIYLHQDERGLWVYDQWQGQPVHKRLIRFEAGRGGTLGSKSNDGKRFAVIQ